MKTQSQRSSTNFIFPSFKRYFQHWCQNYWLLMKKHFSWALFDRSILICVSILVSSSFSSNVWGWIAIQVYYANQDSSFQSTENLMSENTYFSIHYLVKSSFLFFCKSAFSFGERISWVPGYTVLLELLPSSYFLKVVNIWLFPPLHQLHFFTTAIDAATLITM